MFVIYGRKQSSKEAGFVAADCPTCRQTRVCLLKALGIRDHLYFVPVGPLRVWTYVARCNSCGREFDTEAAFYKTLAKRATDLPGLGNTTQSVGPQLTARQQEVMETFLDFNRELLERVEKSFKLDRMGQLGVLAFLGCMMVPMFLAIYTLPNRTPRWVDDVFVVAIALSMGFLLYAVVTQKSRYIRKTLEPALAAQLNGVNAHIDEIRVALERLKQHKYLIGKAVDLDRLAVARHAARTGAAR